MSKGTENGGSAAGDGEYHFMLPNIAKAIWLLTTFRLADAEKNGSILGAIVGLSGLVAIRPHRLVLLGLLSYRNPRIPIPVPVVLPDFPNC